MMRKLNTALILDKLRKRPGHFSSALLFSGLVITTYAKGPQLESQITKYVLAGTTATVAVELGSHVLDSINMKSKIIEPQ